jgi:hypothetical protein
MTNGGQSLRQSKPMDITEKGLLSNHILSEHNIIVLMRYQ